MTDDSGGRTEIIYSPRDLDPATAGIAGELSQQYFLGYNSTLPKDGRWHSIELRVVRNGGYTIRARKGSSRTRIVACLWPAALGLSVVVARAGWLSHRSFS